MIINLETSFVSDTHFGHNNIMKYSPTRGIQMKEEGFECADTWLNNKWNNKIKENDLVIHMGDLFMGSNKKINFIKNLNGNKYLIRGNHDKFSNPEYNSFGFNIIYNSNLIEKEKNNIKINNIVKEIRKNHSFFNFLLFELNDIRFLVSHFPIVDTMGYDNKYKIQIDGLLEIFNLADCDVNLHGHTHAHKMNDSRCINLSVENTNFEPIKMKEILLKINK